MHQRDRVWPVLKFPGAFVGRPRRRRSRHQHRHRPIGVITCMVFFRDCSICGPQLSIPLSMTPWPQASPAEATGAFDAQKVKLEAWLSRLWQSEMIVQWCLPVYRTQVSHQKSRPSSKRSYSVSSKSTRSLSHVSRCVPLCDLCLDIWAFVVLILATPRCRGEASTAGGRL